MMVTPRIVPITEGAVGTGVATRATGAGTDCAGVGSVRSAVVTGAAGASAAVVSGVTDIGVGATTTTEGEELSIGAATGAEAGCATGDTAADKAGRVETEADTGVGDTNCFIVDWAACGVIATRAAVIGTGKTTAAVTGCVIGGGASGAAAATAIGLDGLGMATIAGVAVPTGSATGSATTGVRAPTPTEDGTVGSCTVAIARPGCVVLAAPADAAADACRLSAALTA